MTINERRNVALSIEIAERLLARVEELCDEGPTDYGWRSDSLAQETEALRDAIATAKSVVRGANV